MASKLNIEKADNGYILQCLDEEIELGKPNKTLCSTYDELFSAIKDRFGSEAEENLETLGVHLGPPAGMYDTELE